MNPEFSHIKIKTNTFSRIVFLLVIVTIGLLLVLSTLYLYMREQEKKIFKTSTELYENEIHSLLKLNTKPYTSVIEEITYWDEFVTFCKTKDLKWFNTSVANVLKINQADYVGAYDINERFITKVSNSKIKTKHFIPIDCFKRLKDKKIDKFYCKIPEGIVEIYGATVHPSDDPYKNKYKPQGYFFIVRLLDTSYFAEIEKICTSNISFYKGGERPAKTVSTLIPLTDCQGNIVAQLYCKRAYDIDFWITKFILLIMAIAVVLSALTYYYFSVKWARLPISLIKKILIKEDQASINSLKNIKGEFRYIGKLFEQNIVQRNEIQKAREKAEESDRLKSAFLTNLSHEIRTPLNAVIGFSDLLDNTKIPESDKIEYRKIINRSGKNLITIIDDLIEMSRIDAQQVQTLYSDFDLHKLIKNIFSSLQKNTTAKKEIIFEIENKTPLFTRKIISDKTKLERILKNLLSNAIKFTDTGIIDLTYEIDETNNHIIFNIKDSGIGIDSENIEDIFKRFRKVQNDHTIRGGGLGLGLTIAKEYINMLNGEIWVHSEMGVGTTFSFYIPLLIDLKTLNLSNAVQLDNQETNKTIKNILVAEDDKFNFILIDKILKLKNYEVIHAPDGERAVQVCLENPTIDLVLMDIKMPKMDGYESFTKIKEIRPNLPIIAQTAYTSTEEIEKIFQLGFTAYISKPIQKEKLYDIINSIEKGT